MYILEDVIDRELAELNKEGVQLRHIGRLERLAPTLQEKVLEAVELTKNNDRLVLNVAFNYGGRAEIVNAIQNILKDGTQPEDVTDELVSRYLYTAGVPDPDLLIRTSGEQRLSDFLLWECAYAELYFTRRMWPDFSTADLREAVEEFQARERRFGAVPEAAAG